MFRRGVPHAHYKHEAWVYNCFEGTKEEAVHSYAGEVLACGGGNEDDAPDWYEVLV